MVPACVLPNGTTAFRVPHSLCNRLFPQIAIQLPAHPEQQEPTSQRQTDDVEQLHRHASEDNPHYHRKRDAVNNDLLTIFRCNASRCHTDHNGIITSEHQIN